MPKNRKHHAIPARVGLLRRGDSLINCGLCGQRRKATKCHVPPRCAGNEGLVSRVYLASTSTGVNRTKALHGGMYVFGLCEGCNNFASRWDDAYGQLAWGLQPLWPRNASTMLPSRVTPPTIPIKPGAVARSVLIGMCAINPNLRATHPRLAAGLREGSITALPDDLQLRLALNRSNRGRISGAIGGFLLGGPDARPRIGGRPPGISYDAVIFFPPLAWVLIRRDESLIDRQGFGNATSWIENDGNEIVQLTDLITDLPYAEYWQHDPRYSPWWVEMFSSEITEIVETGELPSAVLRL